MTSSRSLSPKSSKLRQYLTSPRALVLGLLICSLLVNLALLARFGIQHGVDSTRYLSGASNLLTGQPFPLEQKRYLGYIAVVAMSRLVGTGERGIIIFQIGVMALATMALFDLGRQLSGRAAGLLAAVFFIGNVDIARWNTYLLTDSLYISLVLFSTWLIHRAAERREAWWYAAGAAVVLFAALVRPHGWLLVPVAAVYWIARAKIGWRAKCGVALLVLIGFAGGAIGLGAFGRAEQGEGPGTWLRQGVIVWGYDGWRVSMPPAVNDSGDDVASVVKYVLHHPWPAAKLAVARVAAELLHARPFYSSTHNLLVIAVGLIIYPLAVLGFLRLKRESLARLMAAIIGSHMLFVALTVADWDGRFLLYVLPMISLFAACWAAEFGRMLARKVIPGGLP